MVNLSGKPLCPGELQLLSRGLSFCPRPPKLNSTEILDDLERYNRRLRLKEYFATVEAMEDDRRPFRPPSNWMPPKGRNDALEVFISQVRRTVEQSLEARATWRAKDNISMDERRALKSLRERTDIVIKPADKESAVVIMSQEGYIAEVNRQLQNTKHYKLLDASPLMEITAEVTSVVRDLLRRDVIDRHTQRFLLPREPRLARFYILPKIHKEGNPGRPILSSNNTPTESISQYVDHFLQPRVAEVPHIIRDTTDYLNRVASLPRFQPGWLLVTLDVSSLYTNIPHAEGVKACRDTLNKRTSYSPPTDDLCELIELILRRNAFIFDDQCYLQIHGTAMGTRMAPSYANLFMADFEERFLATQRLKPLVWWRFLDDIFSLWVHGRAALDKFILALNSFHDTIQFTYEISELQVTFLDTRTYVKNGTIETDLHVKPTDKHQYLHIESCHPKHIKSAIPYGQALRVRRICSEESNFNKHTEDLVQHFERRGYNPEDVQAAVERARSVDRETVLQPLPRPQNDMVPFTVTYHPTLPPMQQILRDNIPILQTEQLQNALPDNHRVVYRRPNNLRKLLVRAELKRPQPTVKTRGNRKCGGRGCKTCATLLEINSIVSTTTGIEHAISVSATCKSSHVVYVIQCSRCKLQYVGETEQALHERMNSHRSDIRLAKTKEKPVAAHFCSRECKINDLTVAVIDRTPPGDTVLRKHRESRWIRTLHTETPKWMNLRVDRL